jgi:hypothetical protein
MDVKLGFVPRLKVFENRVLKKTFGPKTDEVRGNWRRLHNEELYDLYSSPNILVIKSRRMRWAGYMTRMGDRRGAHREDLRERVHLEELGINRRVLEWILKTWNGAAWTGLI